MHNVTQYQHFFATTKTAKKAEAEPYLKNQTNVNFADKSFSNCIILTSS